MKPLTKLHPLDMALLLALFEGGTLFAMGLWVTLGLSRITGILNDILLGLFIGIIGTVLALLAWNGRLRLRGTLDGNAFSLTYIAIIPASVANAVFLVVLFLLEDAFASLRGVPALGVALLGFAATAGALVLLCFIYNAFPFKLRVTLGTVTRINQVTPFRVALFAGLFEAFILPLMTFLFAAFTFHPLLAFTLNGIISGFVGGLVGSFIFNLLAPYVKPGLR